jgi:hypothetical protein
VSEIARTAAGDAVEAIHQTITTVADGLGEAEQMRETAAAACRSPRACSHKAVTTQGHVLATGTSSAPMPSRGRSLP